MSRKQGRLPKKPSERRGKQAGSETGPASGSLFVRSYPRATVVNLAYAFMHRPVPLAMESSSPKLPELQTNSRQMVADQYGTMSPHRTIDSFFKESTKTDTSNTPHENSE